MIRSKGLEWVAGEFRQLLRIKIPRMSPDPDDMSSESDEEMEEDRDEGGDGDEDLTDGVNWQADFT